ncbi:unnamed protein product [Clonostachys rosea]|uniref:Enoyl reductase (ER) domain-containing protein n=1 Tax=Bionectria ochroleuca TaxID=29856 RepID=A0ABY6UJT0_BIOOC|nr:unnamed protein product [Clonostachys rosea]
MARENLSIHLAERPTGEIIPGETFQPQTSPIPSPADLQDGEILVEVLYLSLDPSLRAQLMDRRSYVPPVAIGAKMNGITVSRVLVTKSKLAAEGDFVVALTGWTEYAVLKDGQFEPQASYPPVKKPQDMLSALGLTGITAWVGLNNIGKPQAGELVVVSGAAGATGSVAGQIAKIKGATVVGIAGTDDKCRWLTEELGFDVALNYKAEDFKEKFIEATKNYIDVYFDNVGGEILDLALTRAKERARFIECGMISQYNGVGKGIQNLSQLMKMRIRMEGFIVFDHRAEFPQARTELAQWLAEGKLKKEETILKGGLKAAEAGLRDLLRGVNTGKLLVEVRDPNEAPTKL